MISKPPKKCNYCGKRGRTHWPYQCKENPNKPKYQLNRITKANKRWTQTRKQWFINNRQDYYTCYLCGISMLPVDTTLDHVIPRSRAPELRYDLNNLRACCWKCNSNKGSKVYA